MGEVITYTSENGYTGKLYGKSSYSIYDKSGNEVLHTGFRKINTYEELKQDIDEFPEFLKLLNGKFEAIYNDDCEDDDDIIDGVNEYEEYERCWDNGNYDDQYCPLCPHYEECSGGE